MNFKFIKSNAKKKILNELDEKFGLSEMPGVMIETAKEKVRLFSGTMNKEEISELSEIANVEVVGLYVIKQESERPLRLSHDACQVFSSQLKKGILEIDEKQLDVWLNGEDLEIESEKGVWVLKSGDDFVGCGVSNGSKVFNYVPKERRVRRS